MDGHWHRADSSSAGEQSNPTDDAPGSGANILTCDAAAGRDGFGNEWA